MGPSDDEFPGTVLMRVTWDWTPDRRRPRRENRTRTARDIILRIFYKKYCEHQNTLLKTTAHT
jgi:hypothetical protein